MANLTEQQLNNISKEVSKVTGFYLEFTEEEQRKPNDCSSTLISQKLNEGFGIFGRCFYDAFVEIRMCKDPNANTWFGRPHLWYRYHEAASNGASMMLLVNMEGDKVEVQDNMCDSAQNWKD